MNEFSAIASIFSFFFIRFVVPVGVVMATGYLANYLLKRSREKEAARKAESEAAARERPAI